MIASVRGRVLSRLGGEVVVETAGVGYRMAVSSETMAAVPGAGQEALLLTHLVLRDDGIHLYGFSTAAEPSSSVVPTLTPPFTPPPASHIVKP